MGGESRLPESIIVEVGRVLGTWHVLHYGAMDRSVIHGGI
jgi:hypothetical protein